MDLLQRPLAVRKENKAAALSANARAREINSSERGGTVENSNKNGPGVKRLTARGGRFFGCAWVYCVYARVRGRGSGRKREGEVIRNPACKFKEWNSDRASRYGNSSARVIFARFLPLVFRTLAKTPPAPRRAG